MARSSANGTPNGALRRSPRKSQIPLEKSSGDEKTDYTRWRLLDENGRQTWHYLETDEEVKNWPQSVADKHHLGLATVRNDYNMLD
jgi:lanosterol synthase